ncbi:putative AdoMet-dependent methyltransferase [Gracilibacillus halotolerans]|uniref:Uncharacterized methyltransferase GGQ92_001498 n=1 Tax=Gracilibacillus halotolerans TaxID=74386 RepID=A0A841RL94_9BACI|nr:class I SAM-dependent methyltransferase [Gracilibacillus halotolerans]MBB6512712.1 putative AdoMet-dependent methyltransferase [Gracilibacillus halotolerans]
MGREFLDVFEEWASSYDEAVAGEDPQYRDVFDKYDTILDTVANVAEGNVLEFGVGTGNLSEKLVQKNLQVFGIEPSNPMREIAQEKFPELSIEEGDFLNFPIPATEINSIVSTYAFHHLKDEEKEQAIQKFHDVLVPNGKVIFADTVYETEKTKQDIHEEAKTKGYTDLLHDLQTEYYPLLEDLRAMFERSGFRFEAKQLNKFVWLFVAEKQ